MKRGGHSRSPSTASYEILSAQKAVCCFILKLLQLHSDWFFSGGIATAAALASAWHLQVKKWAQMPITVFIAGLFFIREKKKNDLLDYCRRWGGWRLSVQHPPLLRLGEMQLHGG